MPRCARVALIALIIVAIGEIAACRHGPRTQRLGEDDVKDVGTDWNFTDTQKTSREILAQMQGQAAWLDRFVAQHDGKIPTVKVGAIAVRAGGDLIHTELISEDIVAYLLNSGRAEAVMATGNEWQISKEQGFQDVNADDASRKKAFQQIGADFLIYGIIVSTDNAGYKEMTRTYTTWVSVADIQSGKVVWKGKCNIPKYIKL